MPRRLPPSGVESDRIPIPAETQKRMARAIGLEALPPWCTGEVGEILAWYLRTTETEKNRKHKTTRGNVVAALMNACKAVEAVTTVSSGVDDETRRRLYPSGAHLVSKMRERIAELEGTPRIYTVSESLRLVGPAFRGLFVKLRNDPMHPSADFMSPSHFRRFVFEAFTGAGIELSGIDEAHLDRLDEFLNAETAF